MILKTNIALNAKTSSCSQMGSTKDKSIFTYLFHQCSLKKPLIRDILHMGSLFMAVFEGFRKKPSKNTSEKVPFLLVRFLWACKENEQNITAKSDGVKSCITQKQALKTCNEQYFSIWKTFRRLLFIDLYYALEHHSIADIISFYKTKYEQKSATHILKSIIYFEDVDLAHWPAMLKDPDLEWPTVKKRLENKVREYTLE